MRQDRQQSELQQDEEQVAFLSTEYAQPKYSICIVVLYGLLCLSIGISYSNYAAIAPQIQQLYGVSVSFMSLTNSAFFAMGIIFFLPSIYCLSYCSVRFNIWTIVLLSVLGAWIECFINHSFIFAFIGSYIIGASFAYLKNIVTRISSIWFAPNQRVIATSVMYSILFSVDLLSLNYPIIFLSVDHIPANQEDYYRGQVFKMQLTKAIISTVSGILALIFFRENPDKPVSPTVLISRFTLRETLPKIFKNCDFILMGLFYGIIDATADVNRIMMREAFGQYGVTTKMVGIAGLISVVVTLIFMNLCGSCSSRIRRMKLLMMFSGVGTLFILALTLIFIKLRSPIGLILTTPALNIAVKYCTPLSYELIGEILFPIPEAFSGSSINFILKLSSFIFVQLSSVFIQNAIVPQFIWLLLVLQIVAMLCLYFVNQKFRRRDIDQNIFQAQLKQKQDDTQV